ncbi:MAG: HAD family phosphatase [Alphaproteobacteria bacterium]|nr:HAD family phosphatase [Alphaproteobacteria bacterium]
MTQFATALFDNDGCLIDSEHLHFQAIDAVTTEHGGGHISTHEWWEHCSGKGHKAIYTWLTGKTPRFGHAISENDFTRICLASYERLIDIGLLRIKPGMMEVCQRIQKTGIPMATVSNTLHDTVVKGFNSVGLLPYMQAIICPDDLPIGMLRKPSPAPWIYAARKLCGGSVKMTNVLAFEDSGAGVWSAYVARCRVHQIRYHLFESEKYVAPANPCAVTHSATPTQLLLAMDKLFPC